MVYACKHHKIIYQFSVLPSVHPTAEPFRKSVYKTLPINRDVYIIIIYIFFLIGSPNKVYLINFKKRLVILLVLVMMVIVRITLLVRMIVVVIEVVMLVVVRITLLVLMVVVVMEVYPVHIR